MRTDFNSKYRTMNFISKDEELVVSRFGALYRYDQENIYFTERDKIEVDYQEKHVNVISDKVSLGFGYDEVFYT